LWTRIFSNQCCKDACSVITQIDPSRAQLLIYGANDSQNHVIKQMS
jgi:hypothetical protein